MERQAKAREGGSGPVRLFGRLTVEVDKDTRVDVAIDLVRAGFADVRPNASAELAKAHADAIAERAGKHGGGSGTREIKWKPDRDASKLAGKSIKFLVESVLNGGTLLRGWLLPETESGAYVWVSVALAAVRPAAAGAAVGTATDAKSVLARAAKTHTERFLMSRAVSVRVVSYDAEREQLIGSIVSPSGAPFQADLLAKGMVHILDSNISRLEPEISQALRAAEHAAKKARLGVWVDHVEAEGGDATSAAPAARATGPLVEGAEWPARVVSVASGDALSVVPNVAGAPPIVRVVLAGVKVTRERTVATDTRGDTITYASGWFDARECLRKIVVGETVRVQVEKVPTPSRVEKPEGAPEGATRAPPPPTVIARVTAESGSHAGTVLSEHIISQGWAEATNVKDLATLQEQAKAAGRGRHAKVPPAPVSVLEIKKMTEKRSQQVLQQLQRGGKPSHQCIVDAVLAPARVRVHVVKEALSVTLVLAGVIAPSAPRGATETADSCSAEALDFAKNALLQRDVEVEFDSADRMGTALVGSLYLRGGAARLLPADAPASLKDSANYGVMLVAAGLAVSAKRGREARHVAEIRFAEEYASRTHRGVWAEGNALPRVRREQDEPRVDPGAAAEGTLVDETAWVAGRVVWQDGAVAVFLHASDDAATLAKVAALLGRVHMEDHAALAEVATGDIVIAKYASDGQLYRARVVKGAKKGPVRIEFIDYGNSEEVDISALRTAPGELATLPRVARRCALAFVEPPRSVDEDASKGATDAVHTFCRDRVVHVAEALKLGDRALYLVAHAPGSDTLQSHLVKGGFARVKAPLAAGSRDLVRHLRALETSAKAERLGMWRHGDAIGEEFDE